MAYENCQCGASCPRILYYSNVRTTYEGWKVGVAGKANNLRTMEFNAPSVETLGGSTVPQHEPIRLCQEDPCEDAPILISQVYNGNGKCSHVPGSNQVASLSIPAGFSIEVFEGINFDPSLARRVFGSLEDLVRVSLQDYRMKHKVRSFIVRPIPPEGTGILFCTTARSSSFSSSACFGTGANSPQRLSVGSYPIFPEKLGGTDGYLSRLVLPPGWKIELFEETEFGGESLVLANDPMTGKPAADGEPKPLGFRFRNKYESWRNRTRSMIISTV